MQVKQENIKRPSLIEPFFNMELSPSNEFIQYIDCSSKSSNIVHKKSSVTPKNNNSTSSQKEKYYYRSIDNALLDYACPLIPSGMSSVHMIVHDTDRAVIFIKPDNETSIKLNKDDNFSIFDINKVV